MSGAYQPVFAVTRGRIVESLHFGAAAVVDASGRMLAWLGDPQTTTYLRSSAKPFQALPFIEKGGDQAFHLTSKEIAVMCASHEGTDEHVEVVKGMQAKVGVQESDLLCGTHPLSHLPTVEAMRARSESLSPNRHNCSGKHTGMLAHARMRGLPISDYINPEHPIQQTILQTLAEMSRYPVEQIEVGIDGCSVPTFALPLYHAAVALARLCDPRELPPERAAACRRITQSMVAHPFLVAGPGRFDTRLMETAEGRLLVKGGAEGYLAIGVMAGALGTESPGVGIAIKISDGDPESRGRVDPNSRVRPAVGLELLRQMGYIGEKQLSDLAAEFGPIKPVTNWRKLVVGEARPIFMLQRPPELDDRS